MKNNIRKNLGSQVVGSMFNAAFKAQFPLNNVEIDACAGCCMCYRRGLVEIFVQHRLPQHKTHGFAVTMTLELARRTPAQWIAEQIIKLLKSESCPYIEENMPIMSVDIWAESNAQWAELERKAAELDAAEQMVVIDPNEEDEDPT